MSDIRETVLRSLSAVGATQEARFYAELFAAQDPERFALIALDSRCLEDPLQEALISNLQILSNLGLIPMILMAAGDGNVLSAGLADVGVTSETLIFENDAVIDRARELMHEKTIPILEISTRLSDGLQHVVTAFNPGKVIFLQPSGGINVNGERIAVINMDELDQVLTRESLSPGQERFIESALFLAADPSITSVYVMASPLNLMAELFTTQGSGTMLRRPASIINSETGFDKRLLKKSIETAFGRKLKPGYLETPIGMGFVDSDYRGGALLSELAGLPYLSKFWVVKAARGEGIARDIWDAICDEVPAFFWRSRMDNQFNDWYMKVCHGMQVSGEWRVFWIGLDAPEVPSAIIAAASAPIDFES